MATDVQTNMAEVNGKLLQMERAMRKDALKTAVLAGALPIETLAKVIVHKDTGNLARSIHSEADASEESAAARVGTNVDYALAEEFRAGGGHAYLRPAYDGGRDEALAEIVAALQQVIRQSV